MVLAMSPNARVYSVLSTPYLHTRFEHERHVALGSKVLCAGKDQSGTLLPPHLLPS